MRLRTALSLLLATSLAASASAELKLAGLFGDKMVLQRDRVAPVWGWAAPGETVTVAFAGQKVSAVAAKEGRWTVELAAMPANAEEAVLTVSSDRSEADLTVKGVLVGDVWLCSGQSNMELTLNRSTGGGQDAKTDFPLIRHFKIAHTAPAALQKDVTSTWVPATQGRAAGFTAVGYYFARDIHQKYGVPIGLIGSNWGGTRIEPWTPPVGFRAVPELTEINAKLDVMAPGSEAWTANHSEYLAAMSEWMTAAQAAVAAEKALPALPANKHPGWKTHRDPTMIYNGMIHPLPPFAIKGAIWYQGESNGAEGDSYRLKTHALIKGWRALWGYDFPFYTVQLANFKADSNQPAGGDGWARLREAQLKALELPMTGMACIIDIGDSRNIHPGNKVDVGKRLARWARARDYGEEDLVPSGPLYKGHETANGAIVITFDHVGSGLMVGKKDGLKPTLEVADGALKRFAIAGADKNWVWADAAIDGETSVVSSPEVPEPDAVRYAFSMNPVGANLYNREGLPASPFRTDDW